jgi:hypothetical protein
LEAKWCRTASQDLACSQVWGTTRRSKSMWSVGGTLIQAFPESDLVSEGTEYLIGGVQRRLGSTFHQQLSGATATVAFSMSQNEFEFEILATVPARGCLCYDPVFGKGGLSL